MELSTPLRILLIAVLAAVGFIVGPIVDYFQERKRLKEMNNAD